jgi:hypothetical protein
VKLNLDARSDADLLTFAQAHVTAMTGNANFTTPLPAPTGFATTLTAYQTALGSFNTAQAAAKTATTTKDTARLALESALTQRGNYAADPTAVVESAGFSVRAAAGASQVPDTVQNLSITAGDSAGELDFQWDPASGASSYDVHVSPDPVTATSWAPQKGVTKSKAAVSSLTSGAKVWARVRAIGPGGTGAWSNPATKIVP